jgi:hypothetical protein
MTGSLVGTWKWQALAPNFGEWKVSFHLKAKPRIYLPDGPVGKSPLLTQAHEYATIS